MIETVPFTEQDALDLHAEARAQYQTACRIIGEGRKLLIVAEQHSTQGGALRVRGQQLRSSGEYQGDELLINEGSAQFSQGCRCLQEASKMRTDGQQIVTNGERACQQARALLEQANAMLLSCFDREAQN